MLEKYRKILRIISLGLFSLCSFASATAQSLDFQTTNYYTVMENLLTNSNTNLSSFNFSSADRTTHPLFIGGIFYPFNDALGRNLWVRVRHIADDPNGPAVGHNVSSTSSSPFRSGGFGGWGGFLYQIDIFRDQVLTGTRSFNLGTAFRTSITVESIETLSDTEWVLFRILDDPAASWSLNSISFTGANPASNPGFSGVNVPFSGAYNATFPSATNTICVIDFPGGGFSEFSMTAVGVSSFLYGYEYTSGGYQGMRLSFGTLIQLPTITSFTPGIGVAGTTVTITGTNFSTTPSNNIVSFNGVRSVVTASTATSITTTVPEGATTGRITVTVDDNLATSASDFIVPGEVSVYNAISPNGDGLNDFLRIDNIELRPETQRNKVSVINRWGNLVFTIDNYDNSERVFSGFTSEGNKLPPGTYLYRVEMPDAKRTLTGYLELRY